MDKHMSEALKQLADKGVVLIITEFSGSGDEGMINSIRYFEESEDGRKDVTNDFWDKVKWNRETKTNEVLEKAKHQLKPIKYLHTKEVWDAETATYKEEEVEKEARVDHVIENFVYEALQYTGVNWYNNEGGYGEYSFRHDKEKNKWRFQCEVHQYHTTSSLEWDQEGDL